MLPVMGSSSTRKAISKSGSICGAEKVSLVLLGVEFALHHRERFGVHVKTVQVLMNY